MFDYHVYSLKVRSEVPITNALPCVISDTPDVLIKFKYISPDEFLKRDPCSEKRSLQYMSVVIIDTAYFQIINGNEIHAELIDIFDLNCFSQLVLGKMFGYLLMQRFMVALHGSSIFYHNKGIVFTGDSGAGKSTTTAQFLQMGAVFLADDISVIGDKIPPQLFLGYPQRRLCRDAADRFGHDVTQLYRVIDDVEKYAIPEKNYMLQAELNAVYILTLSDSITEPILSELTGYEKLQHFMQNIYAKSFFKEFGMSASYMKKCLNIVNQIRIFKVERPMQLDTADRMTEIISESIKSL